MAVVDLHRGSRIEERDEHPLPTGRGVGEVFAPATAALYELGAELTDLADELDGFAAARITQSVAGLDAVLAELLRLRSYIASIDAVTEDAMP